MVRLNVEAVVDLSGRFVAGMVRRGRGAIINVASTAAFQPLPGQATYAATKAFVLSLSEAVRTELSGTGVTVTALCPGPVRTEFVEAAGLGDVEDRTPELIWMSAADVAREAVRQAGGRPGAAQPRRRDGRPARAAGAGPAAGAQDLVPRLSGRPRR
jgi:hypothetical protein